MLNCETLRRPNGLNASKPDSDNQKWVLFANQEAVCKQKKELFLGGVNAGLASQDIDPRLARHRTKETFPPAAQ